MTPTDSASTRAPRSRRADLAALALALVVIASAGVVGAAAFDTAGARISGRTDNSSSLLSAGKIDLVVDGAEDLLFDADGLYPGLVVERCLTVSYVGSIEEVDIRLAIRRSAGDGLERFIAMSVETGTGSDPECTDFSRLSTLASEPLVELWTDHSSFPDALVVGDAVRPDFETTVRIAATVLDDNDAQGLDTDFWVTLEARP